MRRSRAHGADRIFIAPTPGTPRRESLKLVTAGPGAGVPQPIPSKPSSVKGCGQKGPAFAGPPVNGLSCFSLDAGHGHNVLLLNESRIAATAVALARNVEAFFPPFQYVPLPVKLAASPAATTVPSLSVPPVLPSKICPSSIASAAAVRALRLRSRSTRPRATGQREDRPRPRRCSSRPGPACSGF